MRNLVFAAVALTAAVVGPAPTALAAATPAAAREISDGASSIPVGKNETTATSRAKNNKRTVKQAEAGITTGEGEVYVFGEAPLPARAAERAGSWLGFAGGSYAGLKVGSAVGGAIGGPPGALIGGAIGFIAGGGIGDVLGGDLANRLFSPSPRRPPFNPWPAMRP